jgi:hypothetical protein
MNRTIHHANALDWLAQQGVVEGASFISSLPDFTEFPSKSLDEWKEWFIAAAVAVLKSCPDDGVVIFYQRDSKKDGAWVDKGFLCQKAAEQTGHAQIWHKIVCRAPPGTTTWGKPAFSHLLCFSKTIRVPLADSTVDVLPIAGKTTWTRGMGVKACIAACNFVLNHTPTRTIVDPFCGHGTVLSVANQLGMSAVGVELSRKRAEKAQLLTIVLDKI